MAASWRAPVRRAGPCPCDEGRAGAQRSDWSPHRIVVRNGPPIPRRRRAGARIPVLKGLRMRRPIVLALAAALLPAAGAHAEDLLQTYQLARTGDPQLAAAESTRLATREGAVQARALLLPQLDGTAELTRSRSSGPSTQTLTDVNGLLIGILPGESTAERRGRSYGINLDQAVFDYSRISRLRSENALSHAADFQL